MHANITKATPGAGVRRVNAKITRSVANGLGDREFYGDLSASPVDDCGDIVPASGCTPPRGDLIMLDSHDPEKIIGRFYYHVNGDKVSGKGVFAPAGICPNIDRLCALVKSGVVDSLSVGFDPITSTPISGTRGKNYTAWHPLEASVVAIPAQPLAKITGKSATAGAAARESTPTTTRAQRLAAAEATRLDPVVRREAAAAKQYAGIHPEVVRRIEYALAVDRARIAEGQRPTQAERMAKARALTRYY